MTGLRHETTTYRHQEQQEQRQIVCANGGSRACGSTPLSHSMMDAWLRKLHLAGHHKSNNSNNRHDPYVVSSCTACTPCESLAPLQKRKHPSFLKALFKPHEHKAIQNASREPLGKDGKQSESHSAEEPKTETTDAHVTPPVEIPGMYTGRGRIVTVGGKHVPFTRDAHSRKKKGMKTLPRIAEGHPVSTVGSMSMAAYRSRAYYPAKKQPREKR